MLPVNNPNRPRASFNIVPDEARYHRGWSHHQPRIFLHQFDSHEHHCLHYILENLAQRNLLALWPKKNELKKKGEALEHIHPLSFFMHILRNPTLKSHFHHLRHKNNKAWKEFLNGALNSFKEEHHKQNIQDAHIEAFCQLSGKDPHYVRHLMHHARWEDFINHL